MTEKMFMKEAIEEARKALNEGNWPIGCVIELDGKIIARGHNLVYSNKDRFGHAEMIALRDVNSILNERPNEAVLYTTYEPCPMCFGACILGKIKKVVCGIDLDQSGAMYFKEHLPLLFKQEKFRVDLERGVLADECAEVFLKGEPTKKLIAAGIIRINQDPSQAVGNLHREL